MAYVTFSSYYHESPLHIHPHIIDRQSVTVCKVAVSSNSKYEEVNFSFTVMCSGPIHAINDNDFKVYFEKFGTLSQIIRKKDPQNPGKYQRFAFVRYNETCAVDKALQIKTHVIKGQIVYVRRVKDKNPI